MAPARAAVQNSFFFRGERFWGSWQHPSSLLSLRLVSSLVESGRTMGVNKQLARWCLSKGAGFLDNWNFSLGIDQQYRRARLHFNQVPADRLLAEIITFGLGLFVCLFVFPPSLFLPFTKSSRCRPTEWGKKGPMRLNSSRYYKQKAKCYSFRYYQHLHPHYWVNTYVITKWHTTIKVFDVIT